MWTTLRAWSHSLAAGTATLPSTIFTIITTAKCAPDSAAYFLKDGKGRDVEKAHKLLLSAAGRMKGKGLKPAREAFNALGHVKQRAMLDALHVLDQSPTITDLVARIQKAVGFPVPLVRIPVFVQRLEGWWFSEIIERLAGKNSMPMSGVSLGLEMDDLRASFAADSLPIDFRDAHPPATAAKDERPFVEQLRLIKLDDKNINWARIDFYRAYAQRSRWVKDDLLSTIQLDGYDALLKEEWERERDWIERAATAADDDVVIVKRGVELYQCMQKNCPPIRPNCTEPFVGRGSYHLLADRKVVGWHRDYLARLNSGSIPSHGKGEESSGDME
jgi:hypothetical protein